MSDPFGDPFADSGAGDKGVNMFGDDLFSEAPKKPAETTPKVESENLGSSSQLKGFSAGDDIFGGGADIDGFPSSIPATKTPVSSLATKSSMFGEDDDVFGSSSGPSAETSQLTIPVVADVSSGGDDLFGDSSDDLFSSSKAIASSVPVATTPVPASEPVSAPSSSDDMFGSSEPRRSRGSSSAADAYQAAAHGDEAVPTERSEEREDSSASNKEEQEEEEEEESQTTTIHTAEPGAAGKGPKEEKNGFHSHIFPNGDLYEGDWVNDKVHGKGTMMYEKEGKFTGEFSQGKKVRGEFVYKKDAPAPKGGCTYNGEFKADKWHGTGKLTLAEGGTYEGEFTAGQYEGKGTMTYAEGKDPEVYEGQYKKGKPNGQGKLTYKQGKFLAYEGKWEDGTFLDGTLKYRDGSSYTGPFKKNKRSGKGIMDYGESNEQKLSKFDGVWQEDVPQKGVMEWQNGDRFDGEYDAKSEPKKGVMTYSNGDVYTGTYVDGNRSGPKATYKFADGRLLQGEFKKDDCVSGEMKYPDESKYKGEFAADVLGARQGQGVCSYANKDVITGMWVADKIDSGEKKFGDGGSYKGTFDQEGRFNGQGCLRVWPDGHKFEGEFKAGLMVQGKLTVQEEGVYEGTFNEAELKHGQGKQSANNYVFEGTFAEGVPVEGEITYKQSEFKSYRGPVNASFKPEGYGSLEWANDDTYEGSFVNGQLQGRGTLTKIATQETFTGDFVDGVLRQGEAKYGDEKSEIVSYSGEFNSGWQREGQGTIQWRAGQSFTGESKANSLVTGEYRNVNGTSFKGTFNVNGKLFGEGVFAFPSGPEYTYSQTQEGSFPHKVAAVYSEIESESKGLEEKTVSELSEFGVWPELPELSTSDRLPTVASEGLQAIQAKGGQLSLNGLQEKRQKFFTTLNSLHQSALSALETESKTDELARTRFEGRWTIPASDSFTGEYKEKLQNTMGMISKAQQENEAQQNERTEATEALAFLTPTVDTLEAQIRQIEAENPARATLASSLASQVNLIEERKALLASLKDKVEGLDGGAALIECANGEQVAEVLDGVLSTTAALREQIKANIAEHQRIFATIQAQYAEYMANLPKVQEAALNSVLADLEKAIAAFTSLWNQSTLLNQRLQEQLDNEQEPLSAQVTKFVADRTKERKTLANKLMIEELHAAVTGGDIEKIKELCDDKSQTIDVNERSPDNVNALQLAVLRGDPAIIQLLASKGGDVRLRDNQNHTFLWLAISEQKPECVGMLIECGADPDRPEDEKSGETLLHLMAKAGNTEILELLLKAKASPTTASSDGRTALLHGCAANRLDIVKLLVDYGASPNSQDKELDGPLHLSNDSSLQSFLVEHGARLELTNKKKAKAGDAKVLKAALEKWKKGDNILMTEPEVKEGDPKWTGNEGPQCQWCVEKFGIFTRRHHCRRCGALTCDNCSKKKALNGKNKIRICDGCFNNLSFLAGSGR